MRDQGRFIEALDHFNKSIALDKSNKYVHLLRGLTNIELDNYDDAIDDFTAAIALDSLYDFAYFKRGEIYADLDEIEKAESDFKRALKLNPDRLQYQAAKAFMLFEANQFEEALQIFNKINEQDTANWFNLYYRGKTHHSMGNTDSALNDYNKALAINPFHLNTNLAKATLYMDVGNRDSALVYTDKSLLYDPENTKANFIKSFISLYDMELIEALSHIDICIRNDASFYHFYVQKARILAALNRLDEAIKFNKIALQLERNDWEVYHLMAKIWTEKRSMTNAQVYYEKALELSPDNLFLQSHYAFFLYRVDRDEEALELMNYVLDKDPTIDWLYRYRALINHYFDNHKAAKNDFDKAIELEPDDSFLFFKRGTCHVKLGENDKACEDYKKAYELGYEKSKQFVNRFCE